MMVICDGFKRCWLYRVSDNIVAWEGFQTVLLYSLLYAIG